LIPVLELNVLFNASLEGWLLKRLLDIIFLDLERYFLSSAKDATDLSLFLSLEELIGIS